MIRACCNSVANIAVFPLQDVLGLTASHRMNTPGTMGPELELALHLGHGRDGAGAGVGADRGGRGPIGLCLPGEQAPLIRRRRLEGAYSSRAANRVARDRQSPDGRRARLPLATPVNFVVTATPAAASIPAGGVLLGGAGDDVIVTTTTPFAFVVYGTTVPAGTTISISSNGNIQFVAAGGSTAFTNIALPAASLPNAPSVAPYWDDLILTTAGGGIYANTVGTAPNRRYVIEWRGRRIGDGSATQNMNFATIFEEGADAFEFHYVQTGVGIDANGASATVGVQQGNLGSSLFTQHSLNQAVITAGLRLRFAAQTCGTVPETLTAADPTFNRPVGFAQGGVCALSGVGNAVRYKSIPIQVTSSSNLTLSLLASDGASITPTAADSLIVLYGPGGFNPAAGCTNAIAANDDAAGGGTLLSRLVTTTPLAPGNYTAVVTSFDNVPAGAGALPWTYNLAVNQAGCPSLLPPTTPLQNFDGVTPPALPAGWQATSNTAANWASATPGAPAAVSPPNVMAVTGNVTSTDALLASRSYRVTATPAFLSFHRSHAAPGLESGFDGMVLEVSVNGGAFADAVTAGGSFLAGGYTGAISASFGSAIGGRQAWTGTANAFVESLYQLPASAGVGSQVRFRWRMATDSSVASGVVQIDSIGGNNLGDADADLSMALTDAPDPVTAGGATNLVYTATLTNGGAQDAQNARFSLPIPAGTVFVSATPSAGGACTAVSPITCTWAGATAPMGVRSATIAVSIPAATPAGPISATATATSDTTDPAPGNNAASTTTTIETSADLTMGLTDSPDPVVAGTQLTYTATVSNGGPSDAQNVSFALPLAAGTSFVSATPSAGGTCTNVSPVTCTWAGATTPMGNRSATIVVLVAANVANGTNLSATATASSATTDPNAANNAATATTAVIAQADIAMTAFTDSPDPVTAGTNLTYQVAMINNGASDAQNARFSLPLPAGTSFVSAAPSAGGNCTNVSPVTCTWAGATAPTVSRSATIVVLVAPSVLQGTTLNATVTGSSDTTDPVAGNNTLATSTAVIALADLQIGLTASVPTADLGQTVTFTATSTNGGPSDAQNVVLSITLSPDFRYGSHTASAGAVCTTPQIGNSGVISCTWAGATAPGVVRTLAVNAASFSPGTSSIQAATSSNTTDPVPTSNNVASVSVLVGNPVEPIPTLSQWSLMLLGLLVGLIGVALVRRD
jgi:uncharacterized repeat protein (TIGR01451 family)